jgi:hypothetical protein
MYMHPIAGEEVTYAKSKPPHHLIPRWEQKEYLCAPSLPNILRRDLEILNLSAWIACRKQKAGQTETAENLLKAGRGLRRGLRGARGST